MTDKPKTLKAALARITEFEAKSAEVSRCWSAERSELQAARNEIKTTREQFADLKKKLYDAEIELANLRGFISRVREDDAVRDPLVEVENEQGKRQVSKRFPSNSPITYIMQNHDYVPDRQLFGGINRETPKHWTSY